MDSLDIGEGISSCVTYICNSKFIQGLVVQVQYFLIQHTRCDERNEKRDNILNTAVKCMFRYQLSVHLRHRKVVSACCDYAPTV